ncbi:MAG: response regulator transcription factor, partial [Chloroflexota bacterium]|nr:response regulator transcription factor [Chloroflexota bacterium]
QITEAEPIKLLIAIGDMPTYAEGLRLFLEHKKEFKVVGIANDGKEALAKAKKLIPDIALLGLDLPDFDAIEVTRGIRAAHLPLRVMILSPRSDETPFFAAMHAGADGCISMNVGPEQLIDALKVMNYGMVLFESRIGPNLLRYFRKHAKVAIDHDEMEKLTRRQLEILRLVAKGMTNKQIGQKLHLSERTVQAYLANIFGKMGVTSRTEAVVTAINQGWLGT